MKDYREFIEELQKDVTVPEEVRNRFENALKELPEKPVTGKIRLVRWSKMAGAAAALVIVGTAVLGYTNPVLAAKIPIIGRIFEQVQDDLTFSGEYSSVSETLEKEAESGAAEANQTQGIEEGEVSGQEFGVERTEADESNGQKSGMEGTEAGESSGQESGSESAEETAARKYSVSNQGVNITLSEVYSDGMSVYITARIFVEQGGLNNIPEHYTERYISEDAATARTLYTCGEWKAEGKQSLKALENNNFEGKVVDDHTFIGMLKLDLDEVSMDTGAVDLQLSEIGYDDLEALDSEDISASHKIEGSWHLSIPYRVDTESVKRIAVNQKNDAGYGVREIAVSPYQAVVYVDVPYTTLTEEEFSREDFEKMWAEKTEGMEPAPEPPFTYEEYLAQKLYEYYDIAVFNQDGAALMPCGGDFEKRIFAVKGVDITKLNVFMTGNMDESEMLMKQKDMEAARAMAEFAVEVDIK